MFTIARVLCAILLSTCFVKSWRNTHQTHSEYDWSVYWLAFSLICKFHWFWRSNHYLFGNRRVKNLACSLKRSVSCLENDSTCYWHSQVDVGLRAAKCKLPNACTLSPLHASLGSASLVVPVSSSFKSGCISNDKLHNFLFPSKVHVLMLRAPELDWLSIPKAANPVLICWLGNMPCMHIYTYM